MNFKTTLILVVLLAGLGIAVWVMNQTETTRLAAEPNTNTGVEKPLLPEDFGDAREVVVQRRDGQPLTFTFNKGAETKDDKWAIAGESSATASKSVVDGITRRIKNAKVQLTYEKGAAGAPTLAEADLDPPRESVTLKNEAGKSIKVDVGRSPDDSRTYVRVDGGENVLVVTPGLKDLLKKKDAEYRDVALYSFDKSNAYRIEVVDHEAEGGPTKTVLVKTENQWSFKEPFEAAANQKKINDLVGAMSNLRVSGWVDGTEADAGVYGLNPPAVTVSILVEEKPAEDAAQAADEGATDGNTTETPEAEKKPEPVTKTYTLHLSRRSPLGEDSKVYLRPEGDGAFATVMKTTADKMMPKGSDWRELKLFATPLGGAERLTITNTHGTTALQKSDGSWKFAEGDTVADDASVRDILTSLGKLEALGFAEDVGADSQAHGFQSPQAVVEVKLPGKEDAERLEVGDYTDAQAKRLLYVRRTGAPGVAKVRVDDIAKLLKPASIFQNRVVADIAADRIKRIQISGSHPVTGRPYGLTLADREGDLVIAEPADVPTNSDKTRELASAFLKLTAEEVMPADTEPAAIGLDKPDLVVTVDYQGLPTEPEPTTESDAALPLETLKLTFSTSGESDYVQRDGQSAIYRISPELVTKITGEFRNTDLFTFDEKSATAVTIVSSAGATGFEKRDNKWIYVSEPLLPIDGKKVDSLVAQVKALKPERFAAYGADLSEFGLDSATRAMTITVKTNDDQVHTLYIAGAGSENDPEKRLYAVLEGSTDVALLPADTLSRFKIDLAEYEPAAKDAKPAPKPPTPPVKP